MYLTGNGEISSIIELVSKYPFFYTMLHFFWLGNLRERDHWGDPDVDGRIILRWIFRKWEGVVKTG